MDETAEKLKQEAAKITTEPEKSKSDDTEQLAWKDYCDDCVIETVGA